MILWWIWIMVGMPNVFSLACPRHVSFVFSVGKPISPGASPGARQRGVAGCLREAWDQSRGAFLARLDADDEATEPGRRDALKHGPAVQRALGGFQAPFGSTSDLTWTLLGRPC